MTILVKKCPTRMSHNKYSYITSVTSNCLPGQTFLILISADSLIKHLSRPSLRLPKTLPTSIEEPVTVTGFSFNLIYKMPEITEVSSNKSFGGWQKIFSHDSTELKCKMNFGIFLPPQAEEGPVPVIYWLSGLTCTEANFIQKAGSQKYAAEHGVIIVAADTSPRGLNIPGEEDSWDFGTGAGFYVDATDEPWKTNYRMYSYITKELPALINEKFPAIVDKQSIMGHSMGGHGAIISALKNPGQYKSVSAFAPISNPTQCAWGKKAFSGYLGGVEGDSKWKEWDATELAKKYNGPPLEILIDQGTKDSFLTQGQLLPENLVSAAKESGLPIILRLQEDYDHSYFFMATFIEDHIKHHVKYLKA